MPNNNSSYTQSKIKFGFVEGLKQHIANLTRSKYLSFSPHLME